MRLIGMLPERDEILHELQLLGCVEISEINAVAESAVLLKRDDGADRDYRPLYAKVTAALATLDSCAPVKSPLFSSRKAVGYEAFFDGGLPDEAEDLADKLQLLQTAMNKLQTENGRVEALKLSLEPWRSMDIPLNLEETEKTSVYMGALPPRTDIERLRNELVLAAEGAAELEKVSADREQTCIVVICHKAFAEAVLAVLRDYSFSHSALRTISGTAGYNIADTELRLKEIQAETAMVTERIARFADKRDLLKLALDRLSQEIARQEARGKLLTTESIFALEGWYTAPEEEKIRETLSAHTTAFEFSEPEPDETESVPVKLKNSWFSRPLNMVTEMYSLPAYDGVDPNPLMAPFFVLFYGIMLADMAYGLLMLVVAFLIKTKAKPQGGMRNFSELLIYCGISTFIFGALTGSFFGDAIYRFVHMVNPDSAFKGLWSLFDPLNDTLMVLVGAMILGFIQIITGMIVSFVEKAKKGHLADALMDEGSWWLVFIGLAFGALGITWWVAIAGAAALILTQGRDKPTIAGKIIGGVSSLYNITGYFGDILSYSRLMALMLAGSVIAQVFNTLGEITGNIAAFLVIFLLGHTLNFGLNLLGCFVHDLRLQCLEYFGKFYKDGGRPFGPLTINTKYVNIIAQGGNSNGISQ